MRTSSTKSGGTTYDSGSGEAFAGAIRVGTFHHARGSGVELEFFRPGEIESDADGPIYLAADRRPVFRDGATAVSSRHRLPVDHLADDAGARPRRRARCSPRASRSAAASSSCISEASGFSRVVREIEYGFPRLVLPLAPAIFRARIPRAPRNTPPGPVVGVEMRAGMTEHAQLVAGLRMHTLGQSVVDGWMIRPSVGLAWKF